MPRFPRRRPLREAEHDCERTRIRLATGHDFDFAGGPRLSDEELRAAWEELRDEVTAEAAAEGKRPWAALVFDQGLTSDQAIAERLGPLASPTAP